LADKIVVNINEFEGWIFDMDGLLLDTEKICWECFIEACKPFDYYPDFQIYKICLGKKPQIGDKLLEESFRDIIPFNLVKPEWSRIYRTKIHNGPMPVKPGVIELLDKLKRGGRKTAVATSTDYDLASKKLKISGIFDYFNSVIAGDMVTNSKPDPEIYLKAAAEIGADPARCAAFEDSDAGVTAAFRAGMKVFQIIDLLEPSDEVKAFGHTILKSMKQIVIK
jgi:HAD superfamily hydrolase (TIGR01509 family)